jgi:hypothetical protein
MNVPKALFLFCLGASGATTDVMAADVSDTAKAAIHAVRIEGHLSMTGTLSDPGWSLAQPVELNHEFLPREATPARQRTLVKMLYNAEYVYFGFDCYDTNPAEIRAHVTDRDKFFADDFVNVVLDTHGDYQRAYEIVLNPYGIQGDLLMTGPDDDASFDMVWESAASLNDHGWTAEIAVPLKSLRFPPDSVQRWNVGFIRNYPRESDVQISWTPFDNNNPCQACQLGTVEGLNGVQSVNSVDLLPYVVGQQRGALADNADPASSFENGIVKARIGGSIRYAPSTDVAFEAVVNPDFSQVETDAAQISVNSNFGLFYPEKRPFFLSGAEIFQNQTQTFYSRTINNPGAAGRVLGQYGPLSFAYLAASDRDTPFIIPGEETSNFVSTNLESFSNTLRTRYDFGNEDFLGAMLTTRNAAAAHNYVGGVDWNYKFSGNYYFRGEWFYSDTKEVDDVNLLSDATEFGNTGMNAAFNGERYGGEASLLMLRRDGREYSFNLQYLDRSPLFQAQSGFAPSNDLRTATLSQTYTVYPENTLIDRCGISLNTGVHFNRDGIRKELWAWPNVSVQFKGQTRVNMIYYALNDELYRGMRFDHVQRAEIQINSKPLSQFGLVFDGSFGRFIKRSAPVDLGKGHNLSVTATVKPTSRFELDLSLSRARLSSVETGELFFDGYIARAVGIYQFTPELFLRLISQYDRFSQTVDVYPLFSYKVNPFTIFYAGSTFSSSDFGDPYGFRETARQYFLKLQYLIRS